MGTFRTENPGNQPVWVNTSNCKACDICVSVCPAGVLAMRYEISSTLGAMISIEHPEACAKLTDESKARQTAIAANNYYSIEQGAR